MLGNRIHDTNKKVYEILNHNPHLIGYDKNVVVKFYADYYNVNTIEELLVGGLPAISTILRECRQYRTDNPEKVNQKVSDALYKKEVEHRDYHGKGR